MFYGWGCIGRSPSFLKSSRQDPQGKYPGDPQGMRCARTAIRACVFLSNTEAATDETVVHLAD